MSRQTVGPGEPAPALVAHQVLAAAEDSDGRWTVVALTLPPFFPGTPLHAHAANAEGCYILEGTVALTQGEHTSALTQGAAARIPAGTPHCIWNPTASPTTVLLIYTPGVADALVDALVEGVPDDAPPYSDTS